MSKSDPTKHLEGPFPCIGLHLEPPGCLSPELRLRIPPDNTQTNRSAEACESSVMGISMNKWGCFPCPALRKIIDICKCP